MGLAVKKVSSRRRGPIRDTSARKGATPALSKEYQAVFKNTGKPMVIVEEDAIISLANAEFEELSGYRKKEIEGKKSWTEFVARGDRRRVKEYHHLRRSDPMLAPRSFEFRFLDRQEKVKNVVLTIGTIPGTRKSMASLLDITDRRQTEMSQRNSKRQEGAVNEHMVELKKANEALQAEVADLKREMKQLQENEELYRFLVENVDFGINLIDADHNIMMANAEQSKRMHKPVSELIGKKCYEEFEKRDTVCPHCPGLQTMATGQPAEAETEAVRDDGSRFHVRLQTFPISGQDGTTSRFIEVIEDITERKRAEKKIERLAFFPKLNPMPIVEVTKKGHCTYANPAAQHLFPELGKRQDEHPFLAGLKPYFAKLRKKGEPYVLREVEADGGWYSQVIVLVDPEHIRIYSADITERKKYEEILKQNEERYRTLVENIKLGINLIDSDYNIIMVNAALSKRVKKQASEMIGKKCYREFLNRDSICPNCPGVQAMATGKPAEDKVEGVRDDGLPFYMRLQAFPVFGQDGTTNGFIEVVEDITKRKRMEEALHESEERFRTVVETMRVGLSAVDGKGGITHVNDQMCQMLGYTMDEMIGRPTTDFQDEESRKLQEETFAKRRKGLKDPTPYEITWVAKDGRKVNTILTPTPGFSPGGEFTGSFAIFTDITERKRMEESLQESEERFKMLAEEAPFGISIMAPDRTFEYLNPQFTKMFGYTKEDVPDKDTWFKKAYPDEEYRKKVSSTWKRDIAEDVSLGEENPRVYTVRSKDGQDKIIDFRTVYLKDGKQYLVYDNITDRIKAEEALRESEERFRRLIETTKVGVSAIDEKGVIRYANNRFGEIWGYSVDEIMGHHVFDFLDEENQKTLKENLAKRKQGESDSYEITWTRKDGTKVPTILSPTPIIDADGRYKGSYGFITDITERKRMEERLQRYAAELERSNEEVKNFAYIVSHDLRVPLVNLKGYTSELRSALEVIGPNMEPVLPQLNEDKRSAVAMALHEDVPEALEFITNSVSRMDSFINSVLQLSRLGRRELKPESIDMNVLTQMTVENMSHQIQAQGIDVAVGSLPQVVADRTAMEQIMGNILGNAVKYLDPERCGQIEVTAEANNGEQVFRIRDNGRGIAQEDMHKVFAPFRRAGKQDTQGEGMGLAYVQTLVRRHNGRIWCESEQGKGTTFTFSISQLRAEGRDHVAH